MMSAVIAVALGLVPVNEDRSSQIVRVDEKVAAQIGRYTQVTDREGNIRVRGSDRRGRSYDLAIDAKGHVEGEVGSWSVAFDAADMS